MHFIKRWFLKLFVSECRKMSNLGIRKCLTDKKKEFIIKLCKKKKKGGYYNFSEEKTRIWFNTILAKIRKNIR